MSFGLRRNARQFNDCRQIFFGRRRAMIRGQESGYVQTLVCPDWHELHYCATYGLSAGPEPNLSRISLRHPNDATNAGRAANPPGGPGFGDAAPHALFRRRQPQVRQTATGAAKPSPAAERFPKSSNLKLAIMFDQKNVSFGDISVNGSSVGASTIYPKDPKRRLEIWWQNPANRSGIYLILINGQSTWAAPGGMKLGMTLADLEKLNHKPFKLKGFDKDNNTTVSDWDGGALATLTGGCKSGVTLQPDSKASPESVSALPADKECSSNDPAMREVKPKISEILIGY